MTDTDCDTIDLIAYLEGLPDDETRRHLESCGPCRKRLERYQRLTRAMIQARHLTATTCPQRDQTVASAAGESESDPLHLDHCPACRQLASDVTHLLADIDERAKASTVSLPDNVMKLVNQRKATWQARRFKKVLDFKGVRRRKEQERMTRTFFEAADDALPKAAFPDDLAGNGASDKDDPEPSE